MSRQQARETIRNLSTNNLFWLGRFCLLITFFTTRGQLSIIQKKWKTNQKATWDTYFKSERFALQKTIKKNLVFRSPMVLLHTSKVLVVCNFNECLMVDMSEFISFHFVWGGPPPWQVQFSFWDWSCFEIFVCETISAF